MRPPPGQPQHEHFADAATTLALLTEHPTNLVVDGQLRSVRTDYPSGLHLLATYNAPGWPIGEWLVQYRGQRGSDPHEWILADACHCWLVDAFDAATSELRSGRRVKTVLRHTPPQPSVDSVTADTAEGWPRLDRLA